MYDSNISSRKFRKFSAEVSQLYYSVNDVDVPRLLINIQGAYQDGSLSSTQYDKLISELEELGYTL